MPDICMCSGRDCPLSNTCYRFLATPTPIMQSFFGKPPYDKEKKECDYYWEDNSVKQTPKL